MPARRELTMRQLRQMLRLHSEGVRTRAIARTLGVARSTIQDNLKRAVVAGLSWPLPAELTDAELERRLWHRRAPGTAEKAKGQGQGRGRSEIRPELHSRPPAQRDLLLSCRMQRGDQRHARSHQRPSDAAAGRQPA